MPDLRVVVVDDSAFMRHAISRVLREAGGIEVVGTARDGLEGLAVVRELRPDVVTLDVEMPVLDGLGLLHRLLRESPTRVVMLSSLTTDGASVTLDALEHGAIDFVAKPSGALSIDIGRVGQELAAKIRAAAAMSEASFLHHRRQALEAIARAETTADPGDDPAMGPNGSGWTTRPAVAVSQAPAAPSLSPVDAGACAARRLVVVASSTGGPRALQTFVEALPSPLGAAVLLVQHMPAGFTTSLAARLDTACRLPVAEARDGQVLAADRILVAPGGRHLVVSGGGRVQLAGLPPVNGVRPAADVTFQAVATAWGPRLLAVVLTGMGVDGRDGAAAVRRHGGRVIAQDEATATIYGMPAAVAEAGLADEILPLSAIPAAIAAWAGRAAAAERD